ncbi:uncharacterized protein LOC111693819 [Trichogramma pretiosum]|uniref:uncharacterized protein LOC111693819 n=1 Tax=Trichogramma pretiosum TaxID=7493 RepID=UPI000C71B62C|nr:uncharacterized protein LOC111693819 [Trichogramma pretiosum]
MLCTSGELYPNREDYYYFWLAYTTFLMFSIASIVVAQISLCIYFVSINLSKFEVVCYHLERLREMSDQSDENDPNEIEKIVKHTCANHYETLNFFRLFQIFSRNVLAFLSTYVFVALSTTGTMILYAFKIKNTFLILEMIVSFLCILCFAFLMGHIGQILCNASDNLFYQSYFCGWYNLPKESKKILHMMMTRCLTPCELQSAPLSFMKFNYENFNAVVNTSISYMTVIASVM